MTCRQSILQTEIGTVLTARNTYIYDIHKAIFSVFSSISQPNFASLLILNALSGCAGGFRFHLPPFIILPLSASHAGWPIIRIFNFMQFWPSFILVFTARVCFYKIQYYLSLWLATDKEHGQIHAVGPTRNENNRKPRHANPQTTQYNHLQSAIIEEAQK